MTALLIVAVLVLVLVQRVLRRGRVLARACQPRPARRGARRRGSRSGSRRRAAGDLSRYLAACQFGITLASLGIGFLGEPAIATLFEPLLGGPLSHAASVAMSVAIAYVLVTGVHVILGEQVPKIYAIVKAENVARRCSRPLGLFEMHHAPVRAG